MRKILSTLLVIGLLAGTFAAIAAANDAGDINRIRMPLTNEPYLNDPDNNIPDADEPQTARAMK
jgi:hypothetical protein